MMVALSGKLVFRYSDMAILWEKHGYSRGSKSTGATPLGKLGALQVVRNPLDQSAQHRSPVCLPNGHSLQVSEAACGASAICLRQ